MSEPVEAVSIEQARSEQPFWCLCDPKQLYLHNNTDSACRHDDMLGLHERIALLRVQLQMANDKLIDQVFQPPQLSSMMLKALDVVGTK